jgi:hypothetical protein
MTKYRKNIFAYLQVPWMIVMWIFLFVGLGFHILGNPYIFVGCWIVSGVMFVFWFQIHKRAAFVPVEEDRPKRKHKVYREKK